MDRLKSGIDGIDNITGGFPIGRSMLVTGDAGSGKTIFALQFAKSSCTLGFKTVYITTEEDASDLYTQGESFNWDLKSFTDNSILSFIELAGVRARVTEAEMSIDIGAMKGNFSKFINELPDKMVSNIKAAFESGMGTASMGSGGIESYYVPSINPDAMIQVISN